MTWGYPAERKMCIEDRTGWSLASQTKRHVLFYIYVHTFDYTITRHTKESCVRQNASRWNGHPPDTAAAAAYSPSHLSLDSSFQ